MDEKIILKATVDTMDDVSIEAIATKRDIVLPSDHIAIFVASLAPLEEANQNGVRLSDEASRKFLTTINQAQVNFEHFGRGFICGAVIDSWIDEATRETKVAFTFHKFIYADEYIRALGLMAEAKLSVSFELLAETSTKEDLEDGTVRLNDFTYTGMGILLDNPPAYKDAQVFEFARKVKDKINQSDSKELVYANQMLETCDEILGEDDITDTLSSIFIVTSADDEHFHVAEVDFDGNGKTVNTMGTNKDVHAHKIINFQIQEADKHAHRIRDEIMATVKDIIKSRKINKSLEQKGGNQSMTKEETKRIAELKAELGDFAKEVSDEDLLNEEKVNELKQAKSEAEKADEKSEEKAEDEAEDKEAEAEEKKEEAPAEEAEEEAEAEAEETEDKDAKIADLEKENAQLKAEIEAKNSEVQTVRENAEKIGKLKVELADNPHAKDFSDEDYLNETKVEQAKLKKENDDLKASNEELAKVNKEESEKETVKATDESIETGAKGNEDKTFKTIMKERYDAKRGNTKDSK